MKTTTIKDCSVETLFPEAEKMLTYPPCGYAINQGGLGMDTKTPIYGICNDPHEDNSPYNPDLWDYFKRQNITVIVLIKYLDGTPATVRYRTRDVVYQ